MADHKKDAGRTLQLDDATSMTERDTWWRKGKVLRGKVTNMQRAGLDRAILLGGIEWMMLNNFITFDILKRAVAAACVRLGRTEPLYSKATQIIHEPHLSSALLDRADDL